MSTKSVKSLQLPVYLIEKLIEASLFTVKDVLSKYPMELVKILNVPLSSVEKILNMACSSVQIQPKTALEMIENMHQTTDNFDKILSENDLIKEGIICEVCGPAGVGKTQFLFQLCANYLINQNVSAVSSIIYIDTENNFNYSRLIQIAQFVFGKYGKSEQELMAGLKRIFIHRVFSKDDFEKLMQTIEMEILKNNTTLLIIDSLASIVRREFVGIDSSTLNERAVFLFKISSHLKDIAQLLGLSVVVINQIVTSANRFDEKNVPSENSSDGSVIPALGSTWAHFVNVRIILQYLDDERRELLVAKSPSSPFLKYFYTLTSDFGVLFEDDFVKYDGTNPSHQAIRTKPFSCY